MYLTGRWKHGNMVENTFEGTFPLMYTFWQWSNTSLDLAGLRLLYLDLDTAGELDLDWGRDLMYDPRHLVQRQPGEVYCFCTALVGTPLPYHDVPRPQARQLLHAMVRSAYNRSGVHPYPLADDTRQPRLRTTAVANSSSNDRPPLEGEPVAPTSAAVAGNLQAAGGRDADSGAVGAQPLQVLVYLKDRRFGMGGGIANPSVIHQTFDGMGHQFWAHPLNITLLTGWSNLTVTRQVRLLSETDLYISDGGTAAIVSLFLRPGSSAIRTFKCKKEAHCRCGAASHTVSYWYDLNVNQVQYLWYAHPHHVRCAGTRPHSDVTLGAHTWNQTIHKALAYVVQHKLRGPTQPRLRTTVAANSSSTNHPPLDCEQAAPTSAAVAGNVWTAGAGLHGFQFLGTLWRLKKVWVCRLRNGFSRIFT